MRIHLVAMFVGVVSAFAPLPRTVTVAEMPMSPRQHSIPDQFIAVDTSRVMGSPKPLPLEAVRVFAQLEFERPVELTFAPDGSNRVFVVEQRGVIRCFDNRPDVDHDETFLDLTDVVSRIGNEEGLLGLAFHPNYAENGELFVYYSIDPPTSIVSRFRVSPENPNRVDRDSEQRLLEIPQPYRNHNGGSLRFGPDGYLYIGLGDGGLADDPHVNGQNLSTLLGSILRIDVDRQSSGIPYAIPDDNPFVDRAGARGEIWAYGFRNNWRISFDHQSGQLWTADVGQNRFEEVDRVQRGGNYGWNLREGFHDFNNNSADRDPDLIAPVAEYFRHEGQSITGGHVYRGSQLSDFSGHYFYGDYLSGKVWVLPAMPRDGDQIGGPVPQQVADTKLQIAAFGQDAQHELYLCASDGIYQLRHKGVDLKQIAQAFPRKLSDTGLFDSVADHRVARGVIPYEVNVPFWSDHSLKDRYMALPEPASVTYDSEEEWGFPIGTVLIKTFWMELDRESHAESRRLETRLMVHSPAGWQAYTYVYNDDCSEAHLLDGSRVLPLEIRTSEGAITQPYYVPSRSECFACHTEQAGFALGLNTRQLNREMTYYGTRVDQIAMLDRLNIFTESVAAAEVPQSQEFPDWGEGNFNRGGHGRSAQKPLPEDVSRLARAWLEVNCAMCHRPDGIGPGQIDLRADTPLPETHLLGAKPKQGQMSPPDGRLIVPGQPYLSELVLRAGHRGVRQMPPLATNQVSERAIDVLRSWIEKLNETE
ncbi:Quinoprotein glucose dehydrogenase B precursor [Allorhodopirellula heiligendammensis]|uniref:Quinoprotein glucose dehydrogenase B n=2 Tax=Allorhodopirellula heiligendammensis TaxID=2714739 RepID=A0A5C6C4X4_9BACT|nr:Quinoprotein glucose dehydrogenase B precursor [Allorhodopirellula heiligendammensis]